MCMLDVVCCCWCRWARFLLAWMPNSIKPAPIPFGAVVKVWSRCMLRHVTPCYAMPCYAMPCHAMPCRAMPCYAIPCYAMLCHAVLQQAVSATQGEPQLLVVCFNPVSLYLRFRTRSKCLGRQTCLHESPRDTVPCSPISHCFCCQPTPHAASLTLPILARDLEVHNSSSHHSKAGLLPGASRLQAPLCLDTLSDRLMIRIGWLQLPFRYMLFIWDVPCCCKDLFAAVGVTQGQGPAMVDGPQW